MTMKTIKTEGREIVSDPLVLRMPRRRRRSAWRGCCPRTRCRTLKGLGPEEITGPGRLLTQLAGRVTETALGAELSEHLGHPPGGRPAGANVRNGAGAKTVRPIWGRSISARHAIATGRLTPSSSASARRGWRPWTTRSWACTPAA